MNFLKRAFCFMAMLLVSVGMLFVGYHLASAQVPEESQMRAALVDLQNAQDELMGVAVDKGGHRDRALHLIERAMYAVNRGIVYDHRGAHSATPRTPPALPISLGLDNRALLIPLPFEDVSPLFVLTVTPVEESYLKAALRLLMEAQSKLQGSSADESGYRAFSLKIVAKAISEVNKCLAQAK